MDIDDDVPQQQSSGSSDELQQLIHARHALLGQISDLDEKVHLKQEELVRVPNTVLKKRFEGQLQELKAQRESLQAQLHSVEVRMSVHTK